MPWETGATEGKYRYHPGGDASQSPRDAPSAVNVVVVPDVNLPKVSQQKTPASHFYTTTKHYEHFNTSTNIYSTQHLHEKYNKWGKDGY